MGRMMTTIELQAAVDRLRSEIESTEKRIDASVQRLDEPIEYPHGDRYRGEVLIRGDRIIRHGQGRHDCANGDFYDETRMDHLDLTVMRYRGGWKEDKTDGFGVCTYRNGSKYEGEFRDDKRCGKGVMCMANGENYEGEWKNDMMHGSGLWSLKEDVHYYEGRFVDGEIIEGKHVDREREMEYHGKFLNGLAHGEGCLSLKNEWNYQGAFAKGQQSGYGVCEWKSGDRYEGSWQDGLRHGTGKQYFRNACIYSGTWEKDEKHGNGYWVLSSGDRYTGDFRFDQMEGTGMMVYTNGDRYKGDWKKSMRHGFGICLYANGHVYKGEWNEDRREGQGKCRFSDGTKFRGQWENDAWIQSAACPLHCIVSGDGRHRATAGKKSVFQIEARDESGQQRLSGGDVFHIVLRDANANIFHGEVHDHENGIYTASYTVNISGEYQLYVLSGDRECLSDTPYTLHVDPEKPCTKMSSIHAKQLINRDLSLDEQHGFVVSPRDVYGNPCLYDDVQKQFPIEVRLEGQYGECHVDASLGIDGQYHCSFQPSTNGMYRLFVTSHGQHLPRTPLSIQVGKVETSIQPSTKDEDKKWRHILKEVMDEEKEEERSIESAESKFIKEHPDVPVITNLEDLWKLRKLQKERQRHRPAQH